MKKRAKSPSKAGVVEQTTATGTVAPVSRERTATGKAKEQTDAQTGDQPAPEPIERAEQSEPESPASAVENQVEQVTENVTEALTETVTESVTESVTEPATDAVTEASTSPKTVTDKSGTDKSGTDKSGTDKSGTDKSGTDESGTDETAPVAESIATATVADTADAVEKSPEDSVEGEPDSGVDDGAGKAGAEPRAESVAEAVERVPDTALENAETATTVEEDAEPASSEAETDAPPVAETETDAPPVAETETDAPPVAETETDAPPVAEAETDAPPAAEAGPDAGVPRASRGLNTVKIRGRPGGVTIEIGEGEWSALLAVLRARLEIAEGFFRGGRVVLDVGDQTLDEDELDLAFDILGEFEMQIAVVRGTVESTLDAAARMGVTSTTIATEDPAQGVVESHVDEEIPREVGGAAFYVHHGNLRSGQVLDRSESVIVIGDVNPGAQVVSHGDVLVYGRLRGSVHAGADGDVQAMVTAIDFAPTQLRIAGFTSVPPEDKKPSGTVGLLFWRRDSDSDSGAEYAYAADGRIFVEPWNPTRSGSLAARRRRV